MKGGIITGMFILCRILISKYNKDSIKSYIGSCL